MELETSPNPDILQAAVELVEHAAQSGIALRLLGGIAVRLHSPSAARGVLARSYADIDLLLPSRRGVDVEALLAQLGYEPDREFNLLNGDRRLLFFDPPNDRQVDIFVGGFEMCHRIPIAERAVLDTPTLPLAELLLTKLQIVQLNPKDAGDCLAMLLDHPAGAGDHETINAGRIAELCARDWGLWRTITGNLELIQGIDMLALEPVMRRTVTERAGELRLAIDAAPKSLRWKTRAAIGERVRWYELPEEVARG